MAISRTPSFHPLSSRRNQPRPANSMAVAKNRNGTAMILPSESSPAWPSGFNPQARSRNVPGNASVTAAYVAMTAPKKKKIPIGTKPAGRFSLEPVIDSRLNLPPSLWHHLSMPKIHIPTPLRQYAGKQPAVDVSGATVGEALSGLVSQHPDLRRHLYNDDGKLRAFVNVYLNDEDVRYLQEEATAVKEGDSISIVPSIAGGSESIGELPEFRIFELLSPITICRCCPSSR